LCGGVSFGWDGVEEVLEFVDMVEFLFLFGLKIFFELFVLVLKGFDGVRIFGVDFIVELDDVLVEVLLDFLLGFEFEGGELLEVDFNGFEGGFLIE
jgi:hypothetical protein